MPCADPCQIEAVIHAAWLSGKAAQPPQTPQQILEGILTGNFTTTTGSNGRTMVSTSANGRSVSFAVPDGWASGDLMVLAHEALKALAGMPDPANPVLYPVGARRLRANFNWALAT